jgi:diguanylate cyclase (GGDEF)-like protein
MLDRGDAAASPRNAAFLKSNIRRQLERIRRYPIYEPLTGLYGNRHFRHRLAGELAAVQRHGRPISLLLLDVDDFRRVNEAHGHAAGDEALKMIAHVMQGAVRREDVLARLGDEDFAVLARETTLAGGRALGERMRKAVERSRLSYQGIELALTVSVGVVTVASVATFVPGRTEELALEAARRALAESKQAGGNRVSGAAQDLG